MKSDKQLKAKSIKNIVSSDRIQELPESNAAEAVARIPGVSIRREGGEGNKVISYDSHYHAHHNSEENVYHDVEND